MKRFPFAIVSIVVLLVAGAATSALAHTSWSGTATGSCDGYTPWANWTGLLEANTPGSDFIGHWGGDESNWIIGEVYSIVNNVYYVSGTWAIRGTETGNWQGAFDMSAGTVTGNWDGGSSCNGTFWEDRD